MLGRVSPGQQLSLFLLPLDLEPSSNSTGGKGRGGGTQGERGCQSVSGGAWGRPHLHVRKTRASFFFPKLESRSSSMPPHIVLPHPFLPNTLERTSSSTPEPYGNKQLHSAPSERSPASPTVV